MEVDQARAERDVARAQIARTEAIIERKTIRAPFRARVGIADVHPGQYLSEGTQLTTLQGVDDGGARRLHRRAESRRRTPRRRRRRDLRRRTACSRARPQIVAIDARVDPATRNAMVRAQIAGADAPSPGASVRVRVPVGPSRHAVAVPGERAPQGPGRRSRVRDRAREDGKTRAHLRPVESGAVLGDDVVIRSRSSPPASWSPASGPFKLREAALVARRERRRATRARGRR